VQTRARGTHAIPRPIDVLPESGGPSNAKRRAGARRGSAATVRTSLARRSVRHGHTRRRAGAHLLAVQSTNALLDPAGRTPPQWYDGDSGRPSTFHRAILGARGGAPTRRPGLFNPRARVPRPHEIPVRAVPVRARPRCASARAGLRKKNVVFGKRNMVRSRTRPACRHPTAPFWGRAVGGRRAGRLCIGWPLGGHWLAPGRRRRSSAEDADLLGSRVRREDLPVPAVDASRRRAAAGRAAFCTIMRRKRWSRAIQSCSSAGVEAIEAPASS
jgi:hypothetical protein